MLCIYIGNQVAHAYFSIQVTYSIQNGPSGNIMEPATAVAVQDSEISRHQVERFLSIYYKLRHTVTSGWHWNNINRDGTKITDDEYDWLMIAINKQYSDGFHERSDADTRLRELNAGVPIPDWTNLYYTNRSGRLSVMDVSVRYIDRMQVGHDVILNGNPDTTVPLENALLYANVHPAS